MRAKHYLYLVLLFSLSANVYSSGALRFILPYLSTIGSLKEGEIAYDSLKKALVFKTDTNLISLNNIDKTPTFNIPIIETVIGGTTSPIYKAYVAPGKIRIGNIVYTNSTHTSCVHDASNVVLGLSHFDGSISSVTAPTNYTKPIYLYLVGNNSGFKCIFSFNDTGLVSPYNTTRLT